MVSMRLFSGEYSAGTLELLQTLPLKPGQVVLGKLLGAVAILAWMERTAENRNELANLCSLLASRSGMAASFGFGPRYLHSTGQLFKAGRNTGRFLLLTGREKVALPLPRRHYDLSELQSAQAAGDFLALSAAERRVVSVGSAGAAAGLARVISLLEVRSQG